MKYIEKMFHCNETDIASVSEEVTEIRSIVDGLHWSPDYCFSMNGKTWQHQTAYNKAFDEAFSKSHWMSQTMLRKEPKLIGDFMKNKVFVEVQFGNSSTLYRDFYKFQYGFSEKLIDLAVLIVPTSPAMFFPTRPASVNNMAEFNLANTCFTILPVQVPTMLIGLMPED